MLKCLRDIHKSRHFITLRVKYEFMFSYSGTHLGWVWWLLEPMMLLGVYTLLIMILRPRAGGLTFVLGLAATLIPWQWFSKTILRSGTSIVSSSGLILNFAFPKISIVIASVLSNMISGFIGLVIVVVLASLIRHHLPVYAIAFLPLICVTQLVLTVALTLIYVTAHMWVRDLHNVAQSALRLGWFISPGLWTLEMIRDKSELVRTVVWLNPFTTLFESYRNVVVHNVAPPLRALGILALVSLGLLVVALKLFEAHEPQFAKMV